MMKVAGWHVLNPVIPPVGYGIRVYAMTTLHTIQQAKELPELFMKTAEEVTLWRMLRRLSDRVHTRLDEAYLDSAHGIQSYQIKDLSIQVDGAQSMLVIVKHDQPYHLPIRWLTQQPAKVFKKISALLAMPE